MNLADYRGARSPRIEYDGWSRIDTPSHSPGESHELKGVNPVMHLIPVMDLPESRRAWCIVAAAFVVGFVVFGTIYSFGVFLEPIALDFQASRVTTSALFSIASLIFYLAGSVTGYLSDRFGPRIMVGAGAAAMGGGLILTAVVDRLWLAYIAYGIGVGVGTACAYIPTLSIVGGWFDKRRNTALGVAAAGTGCGMLIIPPLAAVLIDCCGWRHASAMMGVGCASLLAACAAAVLRPPSAGATIHRPLSRVVRSSEFAMLYVSWVFATTALFVPFVFLPAFALEHGAGHVVASALLSVFGAVSILGRLGIGALSDRIGIVSLFKISVFLMGASYALWLTTTSYLSLIGFAIVLGLAYGVRIALMPGVLIEIFGLQNLGAVLGTFFTASGISAVAGPLLAGLIVDHLGSYRWAIGFALAMGMLGFIALIPLRFGRIRRDHPMT
jgi:MFS family permease